MASREQQGLSFAIREHLRSNVVAYICLFWLMAGTAIAAQKLPNNSVTSKTIRNGQVRTADLGAGAVTRAKLGPNSVSGAQVAPDSLTGADILESSLTGVPGDGAGTGLAGGDLTGNYPNPQIAPNAVGGPEVNESTLGLVPNADQLDGVDSTSFLTLSSNADTGGVLTGTFGNPQLGEGAVGPAQIQQMPSWRKDVDNHTSAIPANTPTHGCFTTASGYQIGGASTFGTANCAWGFSVPIDGTYVITAQVAWPANTTGVRKLEIVNFDTDAVLTADEVQPAQEAGKFTQQTTSTITRLTAGTFVTLLFSHSATTSLAVQGANLAMAWVGP